MTTIELVRETFAYDPDTGLLRWKIPHGRHGRFARVA